MSFSKFQWAIPVMSSLAIVGGLLWAGVRLLPYRFLARLGAKELPRTPENLSVFLSLERLARRAQLPVPRLLVLEDYSPNAFALRVGKHGVIALTEGLLQALTIAELEAVLSLCLAQLKLGVFRTSPLATALAFPFTSISARLPFALAILLQSFASLLIRSLVRPERMFQADGFAAQILQNPDQIALSLRKLTSLSRRIPLHKHDIALDHMFIISAIHNDLLATACATHPEPETRIERLLAVSLSC